MTRRVRKPLAVGAFTLLGLLALAVAALLASTLLPYEPYQLRSYVVRPAVVCAGDPVTAHVTRRYATEFDQLLLEETWVTVTVPGLRPDRPVRSHEGELRDEALTETEHYETVESPLLRRAPTQPGLYRVRVHTESHGTRWGPLPALGTSEHYSNEVRVRACGENP